MSQNFLNRRRFLRNSCGMMSSIPAINTVLNMSLASNLAQAAGSTDPGDQDYKALICLFMNGGNDAFNMLVPTTASEYNDYELTRSNLSLPKDSLNIAANVKPLNVLNTPGRTFAVHPELGEIAALFNQGNAGFVANVGTLVEPIPGAMAASFDSGAYQIPVSLGAHNTAQTHRETGLPQYVTNTTGWLGRTADILSSSQNPGSLLPMATPLATRRS